MTSFVIRRVLKGLVTLVAAVVLVFVMVRIIPSDPAAALVPRDAPPELAARVRQLWGLDRPMPEQFVTYIANLLRGDAGESYQFSSIAAGQAGVPAFGLVLSRVPNTLLLALVTIVLSISIALPLGVLTAVKADSWLDRAIFALSMALTSIPGFFIGILLIFIFSLWLGLLPTGGVGTPLHVVLPAITLSLHFTVLLTRLTRTEMGHALKSDYVRTAYAKGLTGQTVFWRHALKNVLIPLVTVIGLRLGGLLNGAVIVETLFRWPGVGSLMIAAVATRDYPIIQIIVPLGAFFFVVINILLDVIYAVIDPRLRVGGAR